jgi:hypothetical protein
MMRRLFDALLLKGLWKFKPIHVLAFWCFMAYHGWMASPYFMHYVVGAPEPGTAPRYVGTLLIEGELQRSKTGWIPAKYFIRTASGDVEFHCGYPPYRRECSVLASGLLSSYHGLQPVEVGVDPYWGVDFMKFPPPYEHFNDRYEPKSVVSRRELHLRGQLDSMEPIVKQSLGRSKHYWALTWLISGSVLHAFLALLSFLFSGEPPKVRPRKPGEPPTEAEIAEKLRLEEMPFNTDFKNWNKQT